MKVLSHTLIAIMATASLAGCQSSGPDRTSSTVMTPTDSRPHIVAQPQTSGGKTADDIALSSAVKSRLIEDRTIDSTRIAVAADRGTVYLNGAVDNAAHKSRAEKVATDVSGVSSVVNQLRVGEGGMAGDRQVIARDERSCMLLADIPGYRTSKTFDSVNVRVYDDIWSPLYEKNAAGRSHDDRLTYDGRPWNDNNPDRRTMDDRRAMDERRAMGSDPERRVVEERRATTTDNQGRVIEERSVTSSEERHQGDTRMSRAGRDDRENLIWSGLLKQGQTVEITSARGPIRYDYMLQPDQWYHGNKGAWCGGQQVVVVVP
ncbi:MAG: BON domain-containing protein [Nitrospiraceae bacterium]